VEVLAAAERIADAAAITGPDVEHAVGPKLQLAAVMIWKRAMRNGEDADRRRLGPGREHSSAAYRKRKTFDRDIAVGVDEIDEYVAIGGKLRMKRERKQPAFAAV